MEEGPTALLRDGDALKLKPEARQYLAQGPDLHELGAYALEAARRCGAGSCCWATRDIRSDCARFRIRLGCCTSRKPRLGGAPRGGGRFARADESGLDLAHRFGDAFARAGVEVVSGGARGIDTAAHEGALWGRAGRWRCWGAGSTSIIRPRTAPCSKRLATGGGAVVSEIAPGTEPAARNFPRRNRIVAGLSDAVVVVRAALRSGALITAAQAGARGTQGLRRPGRALELEAEGSNALLRDGQALVATGPIDVLTDLGCPIPEILVSAAATRTGAPASYPASRSSRIAPWSMRRA